MCPELHTIDLSCLFSPFYSFLVNYINQSINLCFSDFCHQHNIYLIDGGYPNFSLASLIPPTQPPVLIYRVITPMADSPSSYHYSDFATNGRWCSDGGQPIIGLQLFYYGRGNLTARLRNSSGDEVCGNGACGDLIVSPGQQPVMSVEFGFRDMPFNVVGMTNSNASNVVEVRVCLVAFSLVVCLSCNGYQHHSDMSAELFCRRVYKIAEMGVKGSSFALHFTGML